MTQKDFIQLCADGTYDEISEAIKSGVDVNKPEMIEEVPLLPIFIAASAGNLQALKALVEAGAKTADGFVAAVLNNRKNALKFLVELGADINEPGQSGYNALLTAVTMNNPEIVEEILRLRADVNAKSSAGHTALTYAAMMYLAQEEIDPKIIELLVYWEADYHEAMLFAIKTDNVQLAEYIFYGGAYENELDETGRSFVMYSVMTGGGILDKLLQYGADPNIPDKNGRTPLMLAVIDEELEEGIIDKLLDAGADIDAVDEKGLTALMWAVAGVDKSPDLMTPALIRTGGLRAEGWEKLCAFVSLYNAAKHEIQIDIVRHLIAKGADVNITDKRGMNAIMYALASGNDETADILVEAGARINFDMI